MAKKETETMAGEAMEVRIEPVGGRIVLDPDAFEKVNEDMARMKEGRLFAETVNFRADSGYGNFTPRVHASVDRAMAELMENLPNFDPMTRVLVAVAIIPAEVK